MMFRMYITTGRTRTAMTENHKIDNPFPDPVQGRRQELEFPIQNVEEGDWDKLADTMDFPDPEDLKNAREDDFDVRISEEDDFDL